MAGSARRGTGRNTLSRLPIDAELAFKETPARGLVVEVVAEGGRRSWGHVPF